MISEVNTMAIQPGWKITERQKATSNSRGASCEAEFRSRIFLVIEEEFRVENWMIAQKVGLLYQAMGSGAKGNRRHQLSATESCRQASLAWLGKFYGEPPSLPSSLACFLRLPNHPSPARRETEIKACATRFLVYSPLFPMAFFSSNYQTVRTCLIPCCPRSFPSSRPDEL